MMGAKGQGAGFYGYGDGRRFQCAWTDIFHLGARLRYDSPAVAHKSLMFLRNRCFTETLDTGSKRQRC